MKNGWDESDHPREDDGKFGSGGGGSGGDGGSGGEGKKGDVIPIKRKAIEAKKAEKTIGKTESGKPVGLKARSKEYKDFSKQDHVDASLAHSRVQSQLSEEYHKQKNPDGTVSKAHIKKREQIKKKLAYHVEQKEAHRAIAEGDKGSPDQKDFDRMDRKDDPDKRSKASRKKEKRENAIYNSTERQVQRGKELF